MSQWGPTGEIVFRRSYARRRPDGRQETWPETVERVVRGNLDLVPSRFHDPGEERRLIDLFGEFAALPAGRHLWMSGVGGRQFLFNCHVAGWDAAEPEAHFVFMFNQLMQGGGVGANYSNRYLRELPPLRSAVGVELVCDVGHPDIEELRPLLSKTYSPDWPGSVRVDDSREGWAHSFSAVLQAAWDVTPVVLVFDLSLLRARGAPIRTFGGTASGPAPLAQLLVRTATYLSAKCGDRIDSLGAMHLDHWIAETVAAGNVRRSARMAMKHWADDDIFDFINSKVDPLAHWSTNISVEIDDEFLAQESAGNAQAADVFDSVVEGMRRNGEPGLWNRTLASSGERGDVICTNPCGEIALEAWENCNLGHINLSAFGPEDPAIIDAHRLMARFLLRATFGDVTDPRQRDVLARNRRIGVGHFGLQGWLVRHGIRYSECAADVRVRDALLRFRAAVRDEAHSYADELDIPTPVKTTTVAPTGSVAKLPGATEGIQPIYARHFLRRVRFSSDDPEVRALAEAGFTIESDLYSDRTAVAVLPTKDALLAQAESVGLGHLVEAADELQPEVLLAVQAMYQECYADNAVSLTVNVKPGTLDASRIKEMLRAYLPRLKGTTLMVDESRPQAPYERISEAEYRQASASTIGIVDATCIGDACPIGNEGWS